MEAQLVGWSSYAMCLVLFLTHISLFPLLSHQEHKVLLTGTPLQNTVEELFSLLHFLEPQSFPSENTFMLEFGDLKTEEQVRLCDSIMWLLGSYQVCRCQCECVRIMLLGSYQQSVYVRNTVCYSLVSACLPVCECVLYHH